MADKMKTVVFSGHVCCSCPPTEFFSRFVFPSPPRGAARFSLLSATMSYPNLDAPQAARPRLRPYKQPSQPVARESNALRASVLDAALQLGIADNTAVADWMFNNTLKEEDEASLPYILPWHACLVYAENTSRIEPQLFFHPSSSRHVLLICWHAADRLFFVSRLLFLVWSCRM